MSSPLLKNKRIASLALAATVASAASAAFLLAPGFYHRPGIPDYDQRRNALPSNGDMHCVPTSFADQFKYMAAAGLTGMDSTYGNSYGDVTDFIFVLGILMGTNSDTGTNQEVAYDIGSAWIGQHTSQLVYTWYYGPDWDWGVNTIRNAVASGSINVIGYGRYYAHNGEWIRDGGHANALAGYDYTGSTRKLLCSDPAKTDNDTNGINGQGDFNHRSLNTSNITLTTELYGQVTHARYTFYTGDGYLPKRRVIDAMTQIMPVWAGWYDTNVDTSVDGRSSGDGSVKTVVPFQLDGEQFVPAEVEPREEIVDWVYDLGQASIFYVTKLGRIFYVDLTTGDDKLIHVVKGASALMVGGTTNDLYVLVKGRANDSIMCFERDDMHIEQNTEPDGRRRREKQIPGRGLALEYDPISGGPAVLSSNLDKAWSFDEDLAVKPDIPVPTIDAGGGKVIFKIDHLSGDVYLTREGSHSFARRPQRGGETYRTTLRLTRGITALVPTEQNCLLIQDGEVLQTFDHDGTVRETQLSGVVVGGPVKMSRSHFAAKRGTLVGPAWRNILPSELGPDE